MTVYNLQKDIKHLKIKLKDAEHIKQTTNSRTEFEYQLIRIDNLNLQIEEKKKQLKERKSLVKSYQFDVPFQTHSYD